MTNMPKSNLDKAIEEAQAKSDSIWYKMTSSIIIILLIAFVVGVFVWAIGAAGDEYNKQKVDPNYGFLYSSNLKSGVLYGCAVAHNRDIGTDTFAGKTYSSDMIYTDMAKCLVDAKFEFYIMADGYNNATAPDILVSTVFRNCTKSTITSQWYTDTSYVTLAMRCMIESGLGFAKKL